MSILGTPGPILGALLEAPGFVFCGQAWETNRRFFHFGYKNLELVSTAVVIENRSSLAQNGRLYVHFSLGMS